MIGAETLRTWLLLRSLRKRRSLEEIADLQTRLVRSAVSHAYMNVPLYRRRWDEHGVEPADIAGVDDVRRLPILTQSELREAAKTGELLSSEARAATWPVYYTSGSSGAPMAVVRGPTEQRLWRAFGLRIWLEHGVRWGDSTLSFDTAPRPSHPLQRAGISRTTWVQTGLPQEQRRARALEAKPDVIVGTPTSLRLLCTALEHTPDTALTPGVVLAHGEILDAATRQHVRSSLGVEPASLYGLTELGYVAWQCPRRAGFHISAEGYVVEILRDGRPVPHGDLGSLVVTDLRSRSMPHLRVDTGDLALAVDGRCACGLALPMISLEGRASDAIVLRDRILAPRAILDRLADVLAPDDYRLRQETADRLRLVLRPGVEPGGVLSRLRPLLGQVEVQVETGSFTPPLPGRPEKTNSVSSALPLGGPGVEPRVSSSVRASS